MYRSGEAHLLHRQRNLFRGSKVPKKNAAGEYGAYVDVDASYLVSPNIVSCSQKHFRPKSRTADLCDAQPFALDHFQVVFSLFDVLAEIYKKISDILGPSSIVSPSHGAQAAFGLSPPTSMPLTQPSSIQSPASEQSMSNYFAMATSGTTADRMSPMPGVGAISVSGFMPAIAIAGGSSLSSSNIPGHPASPPPTWSVAYGDMFAKADQKIMVSVNRLALLSPQARTEGPTSNSESSRSS